MLNKIDIFKYIVIINSSKITIKGIICQNNVM
jgi:hypothetical protein